MMEMEEGQKEGHTLIMVDWYMIKQEEKHGKNFCMKKKTLNGEMKNLKGKPDVSGKICKKLPGEDQDTSAR